MQALPFAFLAIIFYLGAGLWQGLTLIRRVPSRPRLVRGLALVAVACHAVIVWLTISHGGELHLGLFESASLVSWAICLLLVTASLFKPVIAGGAALFPVAAACVLGVMNLRGAVIPIFDLSARFGLGETIDNERNVVIVAAAGREISIADLVTPEITIAFLGLAIVAAIPTIVRKFRARS